MDEKSVIFSKISLKIITDRKDIGNTENFKNIIQSLKITKTFAKIRKIANTKAKFQKKNCQKVTKID